MSQPIEYYWPYLENHIFFFSSSFLFEHIFFFAHTHPFLITIYYINRRPTLVCSYAVKSRFILNSAQILNEITKLWDKQISMFKSNYVFEPMVVAIRLNSDLSLAQCCQCLWIVNFWSPFMFYWILK